MYSQSKNLLAENDVVTLTDFLYYKNNAKIFADRCVIYKGFGIFLYQEDRLVSVKKFEVEEVILVTLSEEQAHYYIRGKDRITCSYLITKEPTHRQTIQKGDKVVISGDHSFGLGVAYAKDNTFLERFEVEIERDYLWVVTDIIEGIIVVLSKDGMVTYKDVKDVVTLDGIKEMAIALMEIKKSKSE